MDFHFVARFPRYFFVGPVFSLPGVVLFDLVWFGSAFVVGLVLSGRFASPSCPSHIPPPPLFLPSPLLTDFPSCTLPAHLGSGKYRFLNVFLRIVIHYTNAAQITGKLLQHTVLIQKLKTG